MPRRSVADWKLNWSRNPVRIKNNRFSQETSDGLASHKGHRGNEPLKDKSIQAPWGSGLPRYSEGQLIGRALAGTRYRASHLDRESMSGRIPQSDLSDSL